MKQRKYLVEVHHATPVRIRQGVADRGGYRRDPRLSHGGGESRWPRSHPPSHHGMNMTRVPRDDGRVVHRRLDTRAMRWRWRWRRLRCMWRRRRLRCRRCRSLRSRSRRRCRHRTTPVDLHRLSIARRHRRRHRGRAWRDRGHRSRAWRYRRYRGLARHSRYHQRQCRCTGKTCRERTDRQRWLNHRVRRNTRTPTRGQVKV